MIPIQRLLLAAGVLMLGACSGSSDKMTPEEAMANVPEELRLFDGYTESLDKARNVGNALQNGVDARRDALDKP